MMTEAIAERRAMRRFDMRLEAAVRLAGGEAGELSTETENVSARGLFFRLPFPVQVGAPLAVTLTFPPHVTFAGKVRVRFETRVIRVESGGPAGTPVGIAAAIEAYEFVRSYSAAEANGS